MRRPAGFDDEMLCARLQSAAARLAVARPRPDFADAVAEIAGMAAGRTDLLAQAAGLALGTVPPDRADFYQHQDAARVLIAAGADRAAIGEWMRIGRDRARNSSTGAGPADPFPDLDALFASITPVELPPAPEVDDRF